MVILDGKIAAAARREHIKVRVETFAAKAGRPPGLAVIRVGEDPASRVYVGHKVKACAEVGIHSVERKLSAQTSPAELKVVIEALNADPAIDGILLQLPLPPQLSSHDGLNWIDPAKDVDCLTSVNLGRLWTDRALTIPCTPWAVMTLLHHYGLTVSGKHAVVVGRSNIVGKPMAYLLSRANATVTLCHSGTQDLGWFTRSADLVVVAAGKPELLGQGDFKPDAVVVDVGIHRRGDTNKLCGDVRYHEIKDHVAAATPVPGGVGPMTITMLLENCLLLAERARG